jgi:glutamine synthetase
MIKNQINMAQLRFSALKEVLNREAHKLTEQWKMLRHVSGPMFLTFPKMERYLPREAYSSVKQAIQEGTTISTGRLPTRLQRD